MTNAQTPLLKVWRSPSLCGMTLTLEIPSTVESAVSTWVMSVRSITSFTAETMSAWVAGVITRLPS